jgi:hypothetical protein
MKKVATFTLFLAVVNLSFAQNIYVTSKDYSLKSGLTFSKVSVGAKYINTELSEKLTGTDFNGNKVKILKDSVWGYETKKGKVYRLRSTNSIELLDTGDLIIYKFSSLYWNSYFFSTSLDSKPYRLNKRNLINQSTNKDCINKVIANLKAGNNRVESRLDKTDRFLINVVIRSTGCNPFTY